MIIYSNEVQSSCFVEFLSANIFIRLEAERSNGSGRDKEENDSNNKGSNIQSIYIFSNESFENNISSLQNKLISRIVTAKEMKNDSKNSVIWLESEVPRGRGLQCLLKSILLSFQ